MRKFNFKFVLIGVGLPLIIEALFMLICAFLGEYLNENAKTGIYLSSLITAIVGFAMFLYGRHSFNKKNVTKREAYLTVTLVWVLLATFGTLPYMLSGAVYDFTDAFFESMCGFTTTGSSALLNIEAFPKSLHLWRSITQWIGGVGIIIFVISFIPVFGGGIGQLYDAEATGISEDYIRPRISEVTQSMAITYIGLTLIGFLFLWAGPMDAFDAICHSLTAISTGGFSSKQASIAFFNSAYTEYVIIALMFFGGTNFVLLYYLFTKLSTNIFKDEEFRWYVAITIVFTLLIANLLLFTGRFSDIEDAFRTVLFQVVAAITTTGFATADFLLWGHEYWFIFLLMILFCGCEGSTSGGMKVSRLVVLIKNTSVVLKRQVHPNAIYMVKINSKVVSNQVVAKVLAFMFLYISLAGVSALILSFTGMTFDESIGVSISSMSSYGFGLGSYGPSGTFMSATPFAKYYLTFLMLVGRLEVFTVLSLFVPNFWRR